jgi:hypothetical protein
MREQAIKAPRREAPDAGGDELALAIISLPPPTEAPCCQRERRYHDR